MFLRFIALRAPEGAEATNPAGVTTPPPVTPATPPATPPAPPPATPAPAAAAPAAKPADPPATTSNVELTVDAFNKRIEQAKKNGGESAVKDALKLLGVSTVDEGKALVAAARAAEEAKKTDLQKATEKAQELEPKASRAESLAKKVAAIATREMGKLTEEQQAAVKRLAGDDAEKQLESIEALAPTWATKPVATEQPATQPAPGQPGAPAAKTAAPPPASTSKAGGPPPPATPGAPDHKAVYAELQKSNPMKAASYATRHEAAIFGDGSGQ